MLRFDLCQSKQYARHHPADRPTQVDLLGHCHDPDTTLAPVGQQVHATALDAGTVWVNCYNAFDNASPWGGFKQSGWGREKGPYGLDLFTQIKSVIINYT
jgi:acyl-CoA reductase-like NAD-dependent aldehyde dehydrogenase